MSERSAQERLAAFRGELVAWLEANAARKPAQDARISAFSGFEDDPASLARAREAQAKLAAAGWGAVAWPREHGGRAATPAEIMAYADEISRYDLPVGLFLIGLNMIGPTIIHHGTDEQRERYLPRLLDGSEIWCQLWSEPGAGSDLASLSTRAERDGDELVLNGQKVWTSGAHYSQYGLGVFRSNPDAPKHRGITCLIVPMDAAGITVRPLRQMTGDAHFNEVFFDDVRVPLANVVGDTDGGWGVARTLMMHERLAAGSIASSEEGFGALLALVRATGRTLTPAERQQVARVYSRGRAFDLTTARVREALSRGALPGPEVSIMKLFAALVESDLTGLGVDVLGPRGMLVGDDAGADGGRWTRALLGSFAIHLGGGTDEIQRNIIAETVLGLPREPDVSRDVPFRELQGVAVGAR